MNEYDPNGVELQRGMSRSLLKFGSSDSVSDFYATASSLSSSSCR